jgi:hypothetical protein
MGKNRKREPVMGTIVSDSGGQLQAGDALPSLGGTVEVQAPPNGQQVLDNPGLSSAREGEVSGGLVEHTASIPHKMKLYKVEASRLRHDDVQFFFSSAETAYKQYMEAVSWADSYQVSITEIRAEFGPNEMTVNKFAEILAGHEWSRLPGATVVRTRVWVDDEIDPTGCWS